MTLKLVFATLFSSLLCGGIASAQNGRGFAGTMTTMPHAGNQARYVPTTPQNVNRLPVGTRVLVTGSNGISTRVATVQARPFGGGNQLR
jgi:hypothetical protein